MAKTSGCHHNAAQRKLVGHVADALLTCFGRERELVPVQPVAPLLELAETFEAEHRVR